LSGEELRSGEENADDQGVPVPEQPGGPVERQRFKGIVAALLGWAVPGLGHLWLGDRARGLIFFFLLLTLFLGGLGLNGQVYRPGGGDPLTTLASVGALGIGVPCVAAWVGGWGTGAFEAPYFEYGSTFTLVAGLLNLLVALDAFDLGSGRRK